MQKKDQVFLYIKDEIEKISSAEEKEILDEAKACLLYTSALAK